LLRGICCILQVVQVSYDPCCRGKVICRLRGGLGNQLFSYATAFAVATRSGARLVIDDRSGFIRDRRYRRQYELDGWAVTARRATSRERMEPFERPRRAFAKWVSRYKDLDKRSYIEEVAPCFDPRLNQLRVKTQVTLDGLWQHEAYFRQFKASLLNELRPVAPWDAYERQTVSLRVRYGPVCALHLRWFDRPGVKGRNNLDAGYYERAIRWVHERQPKTRFLLFSEDPEPAAALVSRLTGRYDIAEPVGRPSEHLWAMASADSIIAANSTFSWWAAWLLRGSGPRIAPGAQMCGTQTLWRGREHFPIEWTAL
jgi:hypothetical protein